MFREKNFFDFNAGNFILSTVCVFSAFNEFPDSSSKYHGEINKEFKHLMNSVIPKLPSPVWLPGYGRLIKEFPLFTQQVYPTLIPVPLMD